MFSSFFVRFLYLIIFPLYCFYFLHVYVLYSYSYLPCLFLLYFVKHFVTKSAI